MSDPQGSKPGRGRSAAVAYGLGLALSCVVLLATCLVSQSTNQAAEPDDSRRKEVRSYAIGFGLALVLTCAAFASVRWPTFDSTTTLLVVLGLALVQILVHFRFFLHISLRKSARDDLQLILFSALIVILMVSGTLVILFNLRARMM